jgi:YbbR domain-containing protein
VITEETATKTVKVIPILTGKLDKDYKVHNIAVVPDKIKIEGIQSEIRKIRNLKTESLDITGARGTFTQQVKIDLKGDKVKIKPNSVLVTVIIGRNEEE